MIDNQLYYNRTRASANKLWYAYLELKDLQTQWNALDYGNTLSPGTGSNAGLTQAEIGAVIFDTSNAITTLFSQGHATNLAKLL